MTYDLIKPIAERMVERLKPHCRPGYCQIAGDIRRGVSECDCIEIVCVPEGERFMKTALGIGVVKVHTSDSIYLQADDWADGMAVTISVLLHLAARENYGLRLAYYTGSMDWLTRVLAPAMDARGYVLDWSNLRKHDTTYCPNEQALFRLLGMEYVEPRQRTMNVQFRGGGTPYPETAGSASDSEGGQR